MLVLSIAVLVLVIDSRIVIYLFRPRLFDTTVEAFATFNQLTCGV